jgi:hypothetical protein
VRQQSGKECPDRLSQATIRSTQDPRYSPEQDAGSLREHDPTFSQQAAELIGLRRAGFDKALPRPVQGENCLWLCRLDRHEPHARTGDRFAARFGIAPLALALADDLAQLHAEVGYRIPLVIPSPSQCMELHATSGQLREEAVALRAKTRMLRRKGG